MRQRLGLGGCCCCHLLLFAFSFYPVHTQTTAVATPGTTTTEADQKDQLRGTTVVPPELENDTEVPDDGENVDFSATSAEELRLVGRNSTSLTVEWLATAGVAYLLTWLDEEASFNSTILTNTSLAGVNSSSSPEGTPFSYTIGNLTKGSTYEVCLEIQDADSNSTCLNATTTPPAAVEGVNLTESGDLVTVIWNNPNHGNQSSWRYIVEVLCEANHQDCGCEVCQGYRNETSDLKLELSAEPGTTYSVRVAAMTPDSTVGSFSLPVNLTTKSKVPHMPLVRIKRDTQQVTLNWNYTCPYTGPASYTILFQNETSNYSTSDGCSYTATFRGLKPYTKYSFIHYAKLEDCSNCSSVHKSFPFSTPPDVPSVPTSLEVIGPDFQKNNRDSKIATVTWHPPEHGNGRLKLYRLEFQEKGSRDKMILEISGTECSISRKTECDCNQLSCRIELRPETEYEFQLQAENYRPKGLSEAAVFSLITTAGVPYFINNPMKRNSEEESPHPLDTSYPVLISPGVFGQGNGLIRKYELFVTKCLRPEGEIGKETPVFVGNDTSRDTIPFVIGENRMPCTVTSCNPPLTPNTEYCSFIRIHTSASYSDYHTNFKTKPAIAMRTILMALLIIVGVLFLVMVMSGLYVQYFSIMRRSVSMELPLVVTTPPDIDVERRILLSDLSSYVSNLLSQRNQGLRKEFIQLKSVCPEKPSRAANLPTNLPKNRYLNILPFDETRVRMKEYRSIPCSDYINASYIHGYSQSRRFIACQGPVDHCVEDFWRMVWEKNVHVIVMVTQCVEKNKMKCSKYWPDQRQQQMKLARLKVQLIQETENQPEGYIIRKLKLSKGLVSRNVKHFHFVSWPDMGCPQSPDDIIGFVQAVMKAVPRDSSHVVVHCSAGVGRTGTFIGLSNLMEEVDKEESVDVFHAVYKMRLHRVNMVQTETQYAFLYRCVLKYYMTSTGQSETSFVEEDPDQEDCEYLPSRTPTPDPVNDSENDSSSTLAKNSFPQTNHLNDVQLQPRQEE